VELQPGGFDKSKGAVMLLIISWLILTDWDTSS